MVTQPFRDSRSMQACEAAANNHALILGAGFMGPGVGGTTLESLGDEVRLAQFDHNDSFSSALEAGRHVRVGGPQRICGSYYRDISLEGAEFARGERVTSIDLDQRRVTTDAASHAADVLAVALGVNGDFAATSAQEGGYDYYSIAGAERSAATRCLVSTRARSSSGSWATCSKCPLALFEGVPLLHDHFLGGATGRPLRSK